MSRASRVAPDNEISRPIELVPRNVTGRGWMKRRLAREKVIGVLLETMLILHSTTVEV